MFLNKKFLFYFILLVLVFSLTPINLIKANYTFVFNNNLSYGMVHPDVQKLQQFLNAYGFTVAVSPFVGSFGKEITTFGALTKTATTLFQRLNNLVSDGIVGPATREVINKKINNFKIQSAGCISSFGFSATTGFPCKLSGSISNNVATPVDPIEIAAFDSITDVDGGTTSSPTYADAAAIIAVLPITVTANTGAVTVPVITWVDTDTYNSATVGSYTFTAILGAIPAGFLNTGNFTATVEVVVGYNSISIIGSGQQPGGWGSGTDMNRISGKNWALTITLVDGLIKFIANGGWVINWGGAGFPSGTATLSGSNIPSTAGTYDATFDTSTGVYNFQPAI